MTTVLSTYGLTYALGGLTFGTVDNNGVTWFATDLKGWDGPIAQPVDTPRSGDHGSFMSSQEYYAARQLVLEGMVKAPDYNSMWTARNNLQAALQLVAADGTLVVNEPTPKQANVRNNGQLLITQLGPDAFSFSCPLEARDPRKYATSLQQPSTGLPVASGGLVFPLTFPLSFGAGGSGGTVLANNAGNFETRPLYIVSGPCTNPFIQNLTTGDQIQVNVTLASGDTLTIDSDMRTAVLNGTADRSGFVVQGSVYPKLVPGNNSILFQASTYNSSALLTVQFRSAWS